jgi:hypothetical protein
MRWSPRLEVASERQASSLVCSLLKDGDPEDAHPGVGARLRHGRGGGLFPGDPAQGRNVQVFGTDLDATAIGVARATARYYVQIA